MKLRLVVMCLLALFSTQISVAQSAQEQFAYEQMNANGSISIHSVDAENSLTDTTLITISPGDGELLGKGYLSPVGDRFLFPVWEGDQRKLRLLDFSTGRETDIVDNMRLADPADTFTGSTQNLDWSPNGRFIAINHVDYRTENYGVLLYDTHAERLFDFGNDQTDYFRVTWSHDSTRLATVSFSCTSSPCSDVRLNIIDAISGAVEGSINISDLSTGERWTDICDLHWSPKDEYISFISECSGATITSDSAVYVAEVATVDFHRAVDFFPTDIPYEQLLFQPHYATTWVSDQSLMVSALLQEGIMGGEAKPLTTETFVYNVATEALSPVVPQQLGLFSKTGNDLVAYVHYEYPENATYGMLPMDGSVEVASFDGQSLRTVATLPFGCGFFWNDTGTYFAYVEQRFTTFYDCGAVGDKVVLLNTITGNTAAFTVDGNTSRALGWVDTAAIQAFPTAIPTE